MSTTPPSKSGPAPGAVPGSSITVRPSAEPGLPPTGDSAPPPNTEPAPSPAGIAGLVPGGLVVPGGGFSGEQAGAGSSIGARAGSASSEDEVPPGRGFSGVGREPAPGNAVRPGTAEGPLGEREADQVMAEPTPAGKRGPDDEDRERRRRYMLDETDEDCFGIHEAIAPPVIGDRLP